MSEENSLDSSVNAYKVIDLYVQIIDKYTNTQ